MFRSSCPEMFLGKDALKICSKFTGEHSCGSVVSTKLLCNFGKMILRNIPKIENISKIKLDDY